MPYKSEAQRRYLHAKHPEIAAKWDAEYHGKKKRKKIRKAAYRPPIRLTGDSLKRFQAGEVKAGRMPRPLTDADQARWSRPRTLEEIYADPHGTRRSRPVQAHPALRGKIAKRMSSDTRLKRQKQLSAGTSIVGGTLGLGALGALALKKPGPATKLSIGSTGLGGVGAYNYASIQNQEAKKRGPKQTVYVVRNKKQIKNIKTGLEPVKKGLETMDFGLDSVHQGQSILVRQDIDKALPRLPFMRGARHAYSPKHGTKGYAPQHGPKQTGRHRAPKQPKYVGRRRKTNAPAATTPAPAAVSTPSPPPSTWTPSAAPAAPAAPGAAGQRGTRAGKILKPLGYAAGGGAATFGGLAFATRHQRQERQQMAKRFNPEDKRKKRLDRYAGAATGTGIGLAGVSGYTGVKALQTKSPTTAAIAGAAGLGSLGAHLGSQRIKSYKKGKGASYRPLARYRPE